MLPGSNGQGVRSKFFIWFLINLCFPKSACEVSGLNNSSKNPENSFHHNISWAWNFLKAKRIKCIFLSVTLLFTICLLSVTTLESLRKCVESQIYLFNGFLKLLKLFCTHVFPYLINGINKFLWPVNKDHISS